MSNNNTTIRMSSLVGLIVTLIIAYGLDRWLAALKKSAEASFNFATLAWGYTATNLIMAGVLLTLSWFVVFRDRSKFVSSIFLVVGLLFSVAFPNLIFLFPGKTIIPAASLLGRLIYYAGSNLHFTYAFITIIGVVGLFFKEGKRAKPA